MKIVLVIQVLLLLVLSLFLDSCNNIEQEKNQEEVSKNEANSDGIDVQVAVVQTQDFNRQIISNGRISVVEKSDLRFPVEQRIANIHVRNGEEVVKGELLAVLENRLELNNLKEAETMLKKANLEVTALKINFGVNNQSDNQIDSNVLNTIYLKSGYLEAKDRMEDAKIRYEQTFLRSPFKGKIANIRTKKGDYISNVDTFCSVIGLGKTEVIFYVLQDEMKAIKSGMEVEVSPFNDPDQKMIARLSETNPIVNENGLIELKAVLKEVKDNFVIEGMNVKVFINEVVANCIVIPKSALILRSNKAVVFTAKNNRAYWNYVKILHENSSQYALQKGIKKGDTIIMGNNNLAQDTKINPVITVN